MNTIVQPRPAITYSPHRIVVCADFVEAEETIRRDYPMAYFGFNDPIPVHRGPMPRHLESLPVNDHRFDVVATIGPEIISAGP